MGKGGFATVFKGRLDGKEVAVKKVQIEVVNIREEAFLKEYKHRNILKLYRVEEDEHFRQFIDPTKPPVPRYK